MRDQPWATLPPGDDPTDGYDIHPLTYWRGVLARHRRRILLVVVAVAVLAATVLLAACDTSPGVVVSRWQTTLGGRTHYNVKVKHSQSGHATVEDVPVGVFLGCDPGDKWPDCGR